MAGTYIEIPAPGGSGGGGNVTGPGSSTDNAVARFDGTTGQLLQNSSVLVDDDGAVTALSFSGDGSGLTNIPNPFDQNLNTTDVVRFSSVLVGSGSNGITETAITLGDNVLINANTGIKNPQTDTLIFNFSTNGILADSFTSPSNMYLYPSGVVYVGSSGYLSLSPDGSASFASGYIVLDNIGIHAGDSYFDSSNFTFGADSLTGDGTTINFGPDASINSSDGSASFYSGNIAIGSAAGFSAWINTDGSASFYGGTITLGNTSPRGTVSFIDQSGTAAFGTSIYIDGSSGNIVLNTITSQLTLNIVLDGVQNTLNDLTGAPVIEFSGSHATAAPHWFKSDGSANFANGAATVSTTGTLKGVGFSSAIASKSANYTATADDFTLLVDASGGNKTITLPAASGNTGKIYVIKKTDSSGNTVTIDGDGSETIDGATTKVISTQYVSFMIQCDGSNWWVI